MMYSSDIYNEWQLLVCSCFILYNLPCCTQVTSTMNDNYWCVLVSSYITYLDVLKWHLPWIFSSFFFIIKCQECNKNRQNVFSTTNYFAIVQRINVIFSTNSYLSLKFENFAVLSKNIRYYFDNKNFYRVDWTKILRIFHKK